MEGEKFIDIEQILRDKATRLYKWMPGFAIGWLKRRLHEDQINEAMRLLKNDYGLDFNRKALEFVGAKVVSVNAHLIPRTENVTIAANHPLGGLDGMALIKTVGDVRPDVHFFVNDILKNLSNYGDVFIAVNKLGAASAGSLRTMDSVFRKGGAVLIFPAGLVSRRQNGLIRDLSWKKSFITQAIDHKRLIQPAFIEGENSSFFYSFAQWRKRLRIRGNLEMLWLPDEMFSARKKDIRIHFSEPFSYKLLDSSKTHKGWADEIYRYIYSPEFMKGISFEKFIHLKL